MLDQEWNGGSEGTREDMRRPGTPGGVRLCSIVRAGRSRSEKGVALGTRCGRSIPCCTVGSAVCICDPPHRYAWIPALMADLARRGKSGTRMYTCFAVLAHVVPDVVLSFDCFWGVT